MRILKISLLLMLFTSQVVANTANYFNCIKANPTALYAFLREMPKGGELHYHLTGGAYPETMLALAAQGDYCLDKKTFVMRKTGNKPCLGITARELIRKPRLYEQTIRAWSLKDFVAGQESSHDHFFSTFAKFSAVSSPNSAEQLSKVMQRAANQNELYLEIMLRTDAGKSTTFATHILSSPDQFAAMSRELLANKDFIDNIKHTTDEAKRVLQQARQILGCDTKPQQNVCKLTVKFQYSALRGLPLEKTFAQALNGFAAAARSEDVVGVNLIQEEDSPAALRNYSKQMQVYNFLHKLYPSVHISLHAGELTLGEVVPEDLRFHINEAIKIGHANRIGHGLDIAYENNAEQLMQQMAANKIAVEINLTSNKKILNISGAKHPLNEYLAHHVPVVLSTDDEGILRTDLTQQYVEAVLVHGLDYPTLKLISRNALTYSFLPGKSIWANAERAKAVDLCQNLSSPSCLHFVKENEKARLQRQLELNLIEFENSYEFTNKLADSKTNCSQLMRAEP